MKMSGIYKIESKIKPNRVYIGSAVNIGQRWRNHLSELRLKKHINKKLQNHFNKYGLTDLSFTILLGCNKEELIKTEQYFIDSYNPYFNIHKIANSPFGIKRSDETKRKQSKIKKGKVPWNKGKKMNFTPEQKEKNRLAHCGKTNGIPLSEERKKKISIANMGKQNNLGNKLSDETKKKIGNANKISLLGKKLSDNHKQNISEGCRLYWLTKKIV